MVEVQKVAKPRGRPPKVVEPPKEESVPEKFTFKSKYKSDKITLKKGHKVRNPDGSMTIIEAQIYAEFSRNTWTTRSPDLAELLRERIEAGEDPGNPLPPLHVVETTKI